MKQIVTYITEKLHLNSNMKTVKYMVIFKYYPVEYKVYTNIEDAAEDIIKNNKSWLICYSDKEIGKERFESIIDVLNSYYDSKTNYAHHSNMYHNSTSLRSKIDDIGVKNSTYELKDLLINKKKVK